MAKKQIRIKWNYPRRVHRNYAAQLKRIVGRLNRDLMRDIRPILEQNRDQFRTDGFLDDVFSVISRFAENLFVGNMLSRTMALNVLQSNESDLRAIADAAVGVPLQVPLQPGQTLQDLIDAWVTENTDLIKDLQQGHLNRVRNIVSRGFTDGLSYKEVAKQLREAVGISTRRANTIARDQIGSLNSQVTKARNEELGVKEFIWRTARDERVRGNPSGLYPKAIPSHWDREGKKYNWKAGAGARDRFPGSGINCRCYAESVIEFD